MLNLQTIVKQDAIDPIGPKPTEANFQPSSEDRSPLQKFIDAGVDPQTIAPSALRHIRVVNLCLIAMVTLSLPYMMLYWAIDLNWMALAVGTLPLVALLNIFYLRVSKNSRRVGHLATFSFFLLLVITSTFTGGFYGANFGWFYLLPVTSAVLVNLRASIIWIGVIALTTIVFWLLATYNILVFDLIPPHLKSEISLFFKLTVVCTCGVLVMIFVGLQRASEQAAQESQQRLQEDSVLIQLLRDISSAANQASSVPDALESIGPSWLSVFSPDGLRFTFQQAHHADIELSFGEPLAPQPTTAHKPSQSHRIQVGPQSFILMKISGETSSSMAEHLHHALSYLETQVSRVEERLDAEQRIRDMAFNDSLTTLPNRQAFRMSLKRGLFLAERSAQQAALIFIDLDRFKAVNDSLGHGAGDQLLYAVAERLNKATRGSDAFARYFQSDTPISRLGGDEFTLFLNNVLTPDSASKVASRILSTLEPPFLVDGHEIYMSASIGIALYPNDGNDAETLLRCSDSAMYNAKRHGGKTFAFFSPEMNANSVRSFQIESRLRHALQNGGLRLFYQPLVNAQNNQLIGTEALLRWHDEELGHVSPVEFIPVAESVGLISDIGRWVISEAVRQGQQWNSHYHNNIRMSVNVSGRQLDDDSFVQHVLECLDDTGLSPKHLELELTESVLMRDENLKRLRILQNQGVSLALDDFGTGYSSLSYLRQFKIDRLKIDRSFVLQLETQAQDLALAASIVSMGQSLGMHVIAEGVETQGQAKLLKKIGCHELQGYLFGKPDEPHKIDALLAQSSLSTLQKTTDAQPQLHHSNLESC